VNLLSVSERDSERKGQRIGGGRPGTRFVAGTAFEGRAFEEFNASKTVAGIEVELNIDSP